MTNGFNSTLGFRQSFGGTGASFVGKAGSNVPNYEEVFAVNTEISLKEVLNLKEPPTMNYMSQTIRS